MKVFAFAFALSAITATAQAAAPQINVGPIFDYLDGSKSTYLKRIYNGGDTTAFVKVSIFEMIYQADGSHKEIPVAPMDSAGQREGLIASPARLIIPTKGMQPTRLLYRGEREQERYYRVRFVPVVPTKDDAFAVDEAEREGYEKSMSAGVNVLTGYGTVFFVRPTNTRFDTRVENTDTRYTVSNQGNSTILVDEFQDCPGTAKGDCKPTRKHHILPQKTFAFDKEKGRVYRFELLEGEANKTIEVKRG
jgi:hypothetical protein